MSRLCLMLVFALVIFSAPIAAQRIFKIMNVDETYWKAFGSDLHANATNTLIMHNQASNKKAMLFHYNKHMVITELNEDLSFKVPLYFKIKSNTSQMAGYLPYGDGFVIFIKHSTYDKIILKTYTVNFEPNKIEESEVVLAEGNETLIASICDDRLLLVSYVMKSSKLKVYEFLDPTTFHSWSFAMEPIVSGTDSKSIARFLKGRDFYYITSGDVLSSSSLLHTSERSKIYLWQNQITLTAYDGLNNSEVVMGLNLSDTTSYQYKYTPAKASYFPSSFVYDNIIFRFESSGYNLFITASSVVTRQEMKRFSIDSTGIFPTKNSNFMFKKGGRTKVKAGVSAIQDEKHFLSKIGYMKKGLIISDYDQNHLLFKVGAQKIPNVIIPFLIPSALVGLIWYKGQYQEAYFYMLLNKHTLAHKKEIEISNTVADQVIEGLVRLPETVTNVIVFQDNGQIILGYFSWDTHQYFMARFESL